MRAQWGTVLAMAAAPCVLDCRTSTEITVAITTDVPCGDLRGTSVTVGRLGEIEDKAITASSTFCDASGDLGSLVVVPSGSRTDELGIKVVAGLGRDVESCVAPKYGAGCVVARRALRYLPHTGLRIAVPLRAICNGVPCGATETCSAGACVNATIADPGACANAVCGEDALPSGTPGDAGTDAMAPPKLPPPCSSTTPAIANALRTFYVDTKGDNANDGSAASPWQTLQYAAESVRAGDAVIVRAGVYAGCEMATGGTKAAPIVFNGEEGAIIDAPGAPGGNYAMNVPNLSYVTIQGFTFAPRVADPNWIAALRVAGQPGAYSTGLVVQNNRFKMRTGVSGTSKDDHAVFSAWTDGAVIKNNVITGTNRSSINVGNSPKNLVLSCNDIADAGGVGIFMDADLTNGPPGISVNALIENNLLRNINFVRLGPALGFDGLQSSRLENNLVYGAHGAGIRLYVINSAGGSKDNVIVNNTVVLADGGAAPVEIFAGGTGNTVFNNILLNANLAAPSIGVYANERATLKSDYNVVGSVFLVTNNNGPMAETRLTLADWQMGGQELHSVVATPSQLFVNAAGGDYHLSAASPAKNAGTAQQAPTRDIEGNARPGANGFDIGAYESPPTQ